MNLINFQQD